MTFKTLLICAFSIVGATGYSQELFESQLDSITSEAQAIAFIEQRTPLNGKLITFNKEKHQSRLAKDLFELAEGGKRTYESEIEITVYKILERQMVQHHRASYVLLDGSKISFEDISNIKSAIISKYSMGVPFENLAKQYSMDSNARRGGDTGWFSKGEMEPEFEDQVINGHHNIGAAFTFDIPSLNAYYVAVKPYDDVMIEEIKVLKIVEPIVR